MLFLFFFSILGEWGGWVLESMENSILFFFFFETFPKFSTPLNEWLVSFSYYKITVIFVTDGIGNLMSGLLGNIFDVDYDDDTLTTSEPLRTPSIQVRIPGV